MIYIYWKKEFLYILAFIFINSIFQLFDLNYKMIEKEINLCQLIYSFSQICLFIPFLIEYKTSQKKEIKTQKEELLIQPNPSLIKEIERNNLNCRFFVFIFFIVLLDFIYIFYYSKDLEYNIYDINSDILIILLSESFLFQKKLEIHHILSILINVISLSLIFIFELEKNILKFYKHLLLNYSINLSLLLIKYLNTIYFVNIFLLGSIRGFIVFFYLFIVQIIYYKCKVDLKIIFIYYLNSFFNYFFYFKIISKLNVTYAIVSDNISREIIFFIEVIFKSKKNHIIITSLNFFPIIGSLIYLEILEIGFCNLNKNTKRNNLMRAKIEIQEITGDRNLSSFINENNQSLTDPE